MNAAQTQALELVKAGHNVYIGGQAGCGKSTTVQHIVEWAIGAAKSVHLTCTTGIACSVYPPSLNAMTVHKWSGLVDCRYNNDLMRDLILHDDRYQRARERISAAEILIIDEVSMLSKRTFELLEFVLRLKSPALCFGGIQMVLVGDFLQLPPVRNIRYGDMGEFCFTSDLFPAHIVWLKETLRQSNPEFVKCIQEVSLGQCNEATLNFLNSMSRPLCDLQETVHLFTCNIFADIYNRNEVLAMPGELFVFDSEDIGESKHLDTLTVQPTIWLKLNAPVMLLRNLSDVLVNGLQGRVVGISKGEVEVHFPTLNKQIPVKRMSFPVFDPARNCNVAERHQIPLKLSFGMTIHKAQGMTLKSAEVDCRNTFQAGQLGVAIGRVRDHESLRIVNFNEDVLIVQPKAVLDFLDKENGPIQQDLSCCQRKSEMSEPAVTQHQPPRPDSLPSESSECMEEANEFDAEEPGFDELIGSLPEEVIKMKQELPSDFDTECELTSMKFDSPINQRQQDINTNIGYLCQNVINLNSFLALEYALLCNMYDTAITTKDKKQLSQAELTKFYSKCKEHTESNFYKTICISLFPDNTDTEIVFSICFKLLTALRKFLLKKKTENYPVSDKISSFTQRSTEAMNSDTARGKLRYIGGYVVAKTRYRYLKKVKSSAFKTDGEHVSKYEDSKVKLEMLDHLKARASNLEKTSTDARSLLETKRKQNLSEGLTNISDEMFNFFQELVSRLLKLLNGLSYHSQGQEIHKYICEQLKCDSEINDLFSTLIYTRDESGVLASRDLLEEIITLTSSVLFKQFTRDVLDTLKVKKKLEHRKQIHVSSKTDKKSASKSSDSKSKTSKSACLTSVENVPSTSTGETIPSTSTTDPNMSSGETVPSTSTTDPSTPSGKTVPSTSTAEQQEDETLCSKCDKHYHINEDWISCDSCERWYHRYCVGLKNARKWNSYKRKKFTCYQCM